MAYSLRDLEPGVLGMASGSPLSERHQLESKPSRMQSVIDTMQSYVHPSTPKLDDVSQGAIKSIIKEKETELANITAERSRLVNEELQQMQEREKKLNEDNNKLKGQLKQLTKDFQYNLQLLKDRDTELELLENQISAHKETSAVRAKELADAIQRLDGLKSESLSHEQRADKADREAQAAAERHADILEQVKQEHDAQSSDLVAQLYDAKHQLMNERHVIVSDHARREKQLDQELAHTRAQLADSEKLNEQLQLEKQSAASQQEQLLHKLRSSETAVSKLEQEHRAFVDNVNSSYQSKDDEIRELRGQLDMERRFAWNRQSGDQKEHDMKINRLQEQLEQESKALKKSVADHQNLELEHSTLQEKMAKERQDLEERLIKSEADKTVALCELESCKKQVMDLQQALTAIQCERDGDLGRSGELSTRLVQDLREKDAQIHQLSQEVACCREEAACMQQAHESACQQIRHLTGELDHIAALSVNEKHAAEEAQAQAKDARQKAEDAASEKRCLKETLERQIAILEDKCDSQSQAQQQEQERLQNYWQKRLAKMEHEYTKKTAKQSAETHAIREECNIAMSRVKDAQRYMRDWQSTVSSVRQHCSWQQQLGTAAYPDMPATQPVIPPAHILGAPGVENRSNCVPMYHVEQTPASLPSTVVYSTTVNVPQSPVNGSTEMPTQSSQPPTMPAAKSMATPAAQYPIHTVHASHSAPGDSRHFMYPSGQQQYHCAPVPSCNEHRRIPFSDATNSVSGVPQPASQHFCSLPGTQPQPYPQYCAHGVPTHTYGHPAADHSHWSSRSTSQQHESEDRGDRYKSSAHARMQQMQERLKASEKNLNQKLGRLLSVDGERGESKFRR